MFSFLRYKRNGLPYGLITVHEFLLKDIFRYYESNRLMRKRSRIARRAIKSAIKFCKKKNAYPSKKTSEAMNAVLQIDKDLDYTQKAIQTTSNEIETAIQMIRQEKTEVVLSLIRDARMNFKAHDFHSGMILLQQAQAKLANSFLKESRTAIFGGLDSELKVLKKELVHKKKLQRNLPL